MGDVRYELVLVMRTLLSGSPQRANRAWGEGDP